ncbi:ArsR family transcriptional regulator [Micromonospora kangleipakensis]|uniref:ArsR family transcriptional regulator n=1 Tax=Micromonospora kangleipakensis TaxID=1077942 RepID=A0A4Q8BE87_9ACTN|nr:helix-turn-helix domain-containing protein [Micromonospora kangleipakensis]RZU75523.1 ArsR family transcriptional regulator [Micromonospora kangleipakensis]
MGDWLPEPTRAQMSLDAVLHALSDPHRRRIVAMLAADVEQRRTCTSFGLTLAKSNRTHHFRMLREAGVVRQWDAGNAKLNLLRVDDLEARFPGLHQAIVAAEPRIA